MEPTERTALLFSQASCALIEAMGMIAHDLAEAHRGKGEVYTEKAYEEVILKYNIHWNGAIGLLRG